MPCRGCGSTATDVALDLGKIPWSDHFPAVGDPEPDLCMPLVVLMCRNCSLVQLGPVEEVLPEPPQAVESATSLEHARASARAVVATEDIQPGESVIEIDSHHGGSWLPDFARLGLHPRDPSGRAGLVIDLHGFAHEPTLDGPLAAHARRLAPGGALVLEFHHLLPLVTEGQIDTIRHGHCVYPSLTAMQTLLAGHGLVVTRALPVDMFGGSLRVTARRAVDSPEVDPSVAEVLDAERVAGLDRLDGLQRLADVREPVASAVREYLQEVVASGRRVAAYGAPSKAPVLLALAGVDADLLPYTVDLAPAKHGCRIPGTRIPIRPIEHLLADRPDEVLILTWDIADEVVAQLRAQAPADWAPRFYRPLPHPAYLP
jgi:hypothetical protein